MNHQKLLQLHIHLSTCQGRTDFLWLGHHLRTSLTISTGVPQGCALSPELFSLYTNDCSSNNPYIKLLKFRRHNHDGPHIKQWGVHVQDRGSKSCLMVNRTCWQLRCLWIYIWKNKLIKRRFKKKKKRKKETTPTPPWSQLCYREPPSPTPWNGTKTFMILLGKPLKGCSFWDTLGGSTGSVNTVNFYSATIGMVHPHHSI